MSNLKLWAVSVLAGLCIAAFLLCLLIGGFLMGRNATNWDLPNCQEDEYLYPTNKDGRPAFEGPGEAKTSDYACYNFENMP